MLLSVLIFFCSFSIFRKSLKHSKAALSHNAFMSLPLNPPLISSLDKLSKFILSKSSSTSIFLNIYLDFHVLPLPSPPFQVNPQTLSLEIYATLRHLDHTAYLYIPEPIFTIFHTTILSVFLFFRPSQELINSFFTFFDASCSEESPLLPKRQSISSMNITQGDSFFASLNMLLTIFSESPNHLLFISEMDMFRKHAPDSVATALANIVFPVPGGPYRRIPLHGLFS